ncbi:hypothetical protein Emed_002254 [Eimeria media]
MKLRLRNCGGRLQLAPSLRRTRCALSSFISSRTNPLSSGCVAASAYNLLSKSVSADAAGEGPPAHCVKSRPSRCSPAAAANVEDAPCSSLPANSEQQSFRAAAAVAAAAAGAAAWVGSSKQKRGATATRGKLHASLGWSPGLRLDAHAAADKRAAALPCSSATTAAAARAFVSLPAAKGPWGGPPAACQQQQQSPLFKQQLEQQQLALTRAFENIRPAVVQVYAVLPRHRNQTDAKSAPQNLRDFRFLGSGFFFDDRGFIVTAAHVLLRPSDVRSEGEASLCGVDEGQKESATACLSTDIAVLRLEGASPARGKISSLQGKFNRSIPEIGEPVVIYAAAQHAEEPIGAVGRVLQPRQTFKNISESNCGRFLHLQLLTLPGMSGAPVCDLDGFVVGMLVKKFDVCGLALSAPLVLRVAEALRDAGTFSPPSIGLLVEDVAPDFAFEGDERLSSGGVRVCSVTPGSAAAKAGLREGDKILVARGEATKSVMELREAVLLQKKGPFDLKVERGEETLDLRVNVKT